MATLPSSRQLALRLLLTLFEHKHPLGDRLRLSVARDWFTKSYSLDQFDQAYTYALEKNWLVAFSSEGKLTVTELGFKETPESEAEIPADEDKEGLANPTRI